MKKPNHSESKIQIQCVAWFKYQYPYLAPLFFAVPNGGSRNPREAAIMKAEGITAGVSDLILNIPSVRYSQLAIEMKDEKGKQSDAQKRYQRYAMAAGIKYVVCRSFEQFQSEVVEYLEGANPLMLENLHNIHIQEKQEEVEEARRQYRKRCNTMDCKTL